MMIENKQGINDINTNSNNTDIGSNKNNRSKLKQNISNHSSSITGDHNNLTFDNRKTTKSKWVGILNTDSIFFIAFFGYVIVSTIITSIMPKMPWWGALIMFLVPLILWIILDFIIKLIKIYRNENYS